MTALRLMQRRIALCLAAAAAAVWVVPAQAQDFWAGKQVSLIVGSDAGSGYDAYGRLVGRHIAKHLPGNPAIIPQNMIGAGSKRAAEHIAVVAPKDGTVFAIVFPGAIVDPLTTDRTKWRYDPTKLEYLGSADSGTRLCSARLSAKVKTFDDARREVATIGASAPGGSTFDYPTMLNSLVGTKFKVVAGYKATGEIAIAVDRGEVDGWCGVEVSTYMSIRPEWLTKNAVNNLVQLAMEPNPEMTAKGIPSIWKYVPPESRKAMELIVSQQIFQRPFIAPPGTPRERIKQMQDAFMAALKDPELLADAEKMKVTLGPRSGPEVASLVAGMYGAPQAVIDQMAKAIKP